MTIAAYDKAGSLVIALAKGRILVETLPLLERVGIAPTEDPERSRKLIFETRDPTVRLLVIRATDVPTYVEYGAADLGISGKDTLLEYDGDGFYEPLDLGISNCRMMVAWREGAERSGDRLRVATKYPRVAREFFAERGIQTEVIKLYGSMELAPLVGLADCIVDLVDTGKTLKANGLVATDDICGISSRLIVNKASMKIKHRRISDLLERLKETIA